jgi:hypothetical protein
MLSIQSLLTSDKEVQIMKGPVEANGPQGAKDPAPTSAITVSVELSPLSCPENRATPGRSGPSGVLGPSGALGPLVVPPGFLNPQPLTVYAHCADFSGVVCTIKGDGEHKVSTDFFPVTFDKKLNCFFVDRTKKKIHTRFKFYIKGKNPEYEHTLKQGTHVFYFPVNSKYMAGRIVVNNNITSEQCFIVKTPRSFHKAKILSQVSALDDVKKLPGMGPLASKYLREHYNVWTVRDFSNMTQDQLIDFQQGFHKPKSQCSMESVLKAWALAKKY